MVAGQGPPAAPVVVAETAHQHAEDGKTELSLIHFALTNPEWRPPAANEDFLKALRRQIQHDLAAAVHNPLALQPSLLASSYVPGASAYAYPAMLSSALFQQRNAAAAAAAPPSSVVGRGVARSEGARSLPECRSFISRFVSTPFPIFPYKRNSILRYD